MNKLSTAIIVVVVLIGAIWWFNGGGSSVPLYPSYSASPTMGATKTPGVSKTKTPTPTPVPLVTSDLSYSQLVAQYGSNRVQFDNNCQAQPSTAVFKNGTSILLDNRANQTRTIGVNGRIYTLAPYGYQVITLSTASVPQTLKLSCNNLVNVGTIQLQANVSGQ